MWTKPTYRDIKPGKAFVHHKIIKAWFYTSQRPSCFSCDFWWNTNVTPLDQAPFNNTSSNPFRSAQWFHSDRFALQSVPSGGGWTWILFTHRRHLNLWRTGELHCFVDFKTTESNNGGNLQSNCSQILDQITTVTWSQILDQNNHS